ncbi:TerD family protein [Nocardia vinacea]|uniref:TerD family protein n=1 Tax=Nocardia vinacea TaxID=96468 RepID=A0ABZ1YLA9_9NOCA|nr:TerD family protein [Nocardia vinacea]
MSASLYKGQNVSLPNGVGRIEVILGWAEREIEVDASALLLGPDGKVSSDRDFVFYNEPASSDGSVRFLGTRVTGAGAQARIAIDCPAVPEAVERVALVGSLAVGNFGALGKVSLRVVDGAGHTLAEYSTDDASTESAFHFGEVYRRNGQWKVRAVGQGWDSGLVGLARDFGVDVDDEPAPIAAVGPANSSPAVAYPAGSSYRLWGQARTYCDYELNVEEEFLPAIRSLFPPDFTDGRETLRPDVQLISEPDGPRGQWAISVRTEGRTIGYLGADDAPQWAGVLRRILGSGFIPTTSSRIWAREYEGWDGDDFSAYVQIALGKPSEAIPANEPPAVPYTMLPRSTIVQVTREHDHFDVLRKHVPAQGYGLMFVTLHENVPDSGRSKPHVEVRIDNERVGQLTPQMSQRFLPMIQHLDGRGLVTACWADITGSAVAAKVRIDGIKANEATDEVLNGRPVTIPALLPELMDPLAYDVSLMRAHLRPLPLVRTVSRPIPAEPPNGALVRFDRSRYNFIAVRQGDVWETTATQTGAAIDEAMSWSALASRVRKFEIATAWAPVDRRGDARVRASLAVVRFSIGGRYLAALNISSNGTEEGDWYTTVTERAGRHLPFGSYAAWSDIAQHGKQIQVVTAWAPLPD